MIDLEKIDSLTEEQRVLAAAQLIPQILARCEKDWWYWLKWVKTRDEADPNAPIKPFPREKEYVKIVWDTITAEQRTVIAKSRQMMVSWCLCALCVALARFRPHQAIYWQSQQYTDACAMVSQPGGGYMGRCQFIEENLPTWMRVGAKCGEALIQYPNGSMIRAVAGGADKVRGQVFSLYVGDEFARQEDQSGVYATVAPLIQKGAKAVFISTPNGLANHFATLWHGRPMTDAA